MWTKIRAVALSSALLVGGVSMIAGAQEGKKINDAGIYQAFGEKAGLQKIMDDFMLNLLADARTKPFFENADQERVKEQLVMQICAILNGPCVYKGAAMKPIHANLNIKREHFNALVEQLQVAMDKHNVPFAAQNKLLAVLAPIHREIVSK